MRNIEDIVIELCLIVSSISVDFELKRDEMTQELFINEKSDLIDYLKVFLKYLKNRALVIKKYSLNKNSLIEVEKLSNHLYQLAKKDVFPNTKENDQELLETDSFRNKLRDLVLNNNKIDKI